MDIKYLRKTLPHFKWQAKRVGFFGSLQYIGTNAERNVTVYACGHYCDIDDSCSISWRVQDNITGKGYSNFWQFEWEEKENFGD